MAGKFRKFILFTLLISVLLHEPTFKLFVNLLVNIHTFSRITFEIICTLVATHIPAVAFVTSAMFHELQASISQRCEWAISGMALLGHTGLLYLMTWTTVWLQESPLWLCELNELIIHTEEGGAWRLQDEADDGKRMEKWFMAVRTVAKLCEGVRSRYE
jgi:hypothetical protein